MTVIVTNYRYKRPPKRVKAAVIEGPSIVRSGGKQSNLLPKLHTSPGTEEGKPGIVTARKPRASRFGDVPELTPEEHRRRGDAADALFREIARCTLTVAGRPGIEGSSGPEGAPSNGGSYGRYRG